MVREYSSLSLCLHLFIRNTRQYGPHRDPDTTCHEEEYGQSIGQYRSMMKSWRQPNFSASLHRLLWHRQNVHVSHLHDTIQSVILFTESVIRSPVADLMAVAVYEEEKVRVFSFPWIVFLFMHVSFILYSWLFFSNRCHSKHDHEKAITWFWIIFFFTDHAFDWSAHDIPLSICLHSFHSISSEWIRAGTNKEASCQPTSSGSLSKKNINFRQ